LRSEGLVAPTDQPDAPLPGLRDAVRSGAGSLFVARVVSGGGTLVLFVGIARLLPLEAVGVFALAWSVSYILATATELGYGMFAIREVAQRPDRLGRIIGGLLPVRVALLVPAVGVAAGLAIGIGRPETAPVLALATVAATVGQLSQTGRDFLIPMRRIGLASLLSIGENLLRLGVGILIAVATGSVMAVYLGTLLVCAASAGLTFLLVWQVGRPVSVANGVREWRTTLRGSAGFAVFVTVTAVYFHAHTAVAGALLPISAVALLQAPLRLFFAVEYLPEAVARWAYPDLARRALGSGRDFSELVARAAGGLVLVGIGVAGVLLVGAPLIVPAVFGPDFADASLLLQIMAVGIPARYASHLYGTALSAGGDQSSRAWLAGGVTAATLVLEVVLVSLAGLTGAAASLALSAVVLSVGYVGAARRSWSSPPALWPLASALGFGLVASLILWQ